MKRFLEAMATLIAGFLFGGGLALSGMTRPTKVLGFLDPFGRWDPSLMFVMMGAIGVHLFAYRLVRKRPSPLLAREFSIPTRRDIDLKLVAGSAVFGVGWGLGGYCPGPGLVSLASATSSVFVFVSFMVAGMYVAAKIEATLARRGDVARTSMDAASNA